MLSYRHEFHAGNTGDLIKHATLARVIAYLKQKPAPIRYIDSHAGPGLYAVDNAIARKTGEFARGVGSLNFDTLPELLHDYGQAQQPWLALKQYAGSPLLASALLRPQDELRLYELHSTEFPRLKELFSRDRRARVFNESGYGSLAAQLPVQNARALALIDPSYELKTDYEQVVTCVQKGYERMPNAVFAIWYPVAGNPALPVMLKKLAALAEKNVWRFELKVAADDAGGMTATGMLLINPPWTLKDELITVFDVLVPQLPYVDAHFTAECLKPS